jgi:hypothetical protein
MIAESVDVIAEHVDGPMNHVDKSIERVDRPLQCGDKPMDRVNEPLGRVNDLVECVYGVVKQVDRLEQPFNELEEHGDAVVLASKSLDFTFFLGEISYIRGCAHNLAKGIQAMSAGTKTPYTGPLVVDATALKDHLVDYAPGAQVGLKHEKPGFNDVLDELKRAKDGALAAVGIAAEIVTRIENRTMTLEEIRAQKEVARKLYEVLGETEADFENAREGDIALISRAVQAAAQHLDAGTAAHFETTLKYYSQIADKAVATRRKNAKEGKKEEG